MEYSLSSLEIILLIVNVLLTSVVWSMNRTINKLINNPQSKRNDNITI